MKRVINHTAYNTETAVWLAEFDNRWCSSEAEHWDETLMLTKTGKLFLHKSGGARTKYAQPVEGDEGWLEWGQVIEPITVEEAKAWVENAEKMYKKDDELSLGFIPPYNNLTKLNNLLDRLVA